MVIKFFLLMFHLVRKGNQSPKRILSIRNNWANSNVNTHSGFVYKELLSYLITSAALAQDTNAPGIQHTIILVVGSNPDSNKKKSLSW